MRTEEALKRAAEHCFLAGVGDVGEQLCAANMQYGIAKIQHVQAELGLPQDASFIGAPDATVTRNTNRWGQGFGYGGRIQWSGDFGVLDVKSNHCGMIAVALDDPPPREEIEERARTMRDQPLRVDGVEVEFDLTESNHFLDLCEVRESRSSALPVDKTLAVIHSSGHEHRERSPKGPGIYWDASSELAQLMETRETPWGPLHIVRGDNARQYDEAYRWCQDFSLSRREAIARALLGPLEVICNRTHQGQLALNDCILGCYTFDAADLKSGQLLPLTLGPELPIYFVAPRPNYDPETLEQVGFAERARKYGLEERLGRVNLLPHGGGYSYAQYKSVRGVRENGGARAFELEKAGGGVDLVTDVRRAAYGYRGDEVRRRMLELRQGEPVAKAEITYILRV